MCYYARRDSLYDIPGDNPHHTATQNEALRNLGFYNAYPPAFNITPDLGGVGTLYQATHTHRRKGYRVLRVKLSCRSPSGNGAGRSSTIITSVLAAR